MTTWTINGNTYSDDSSPGTRNLDNGGHRTWFPPLMTDVATVGAQAASNAASAAASATLATSLAGTAITGNSNTSLTIGTGTKVLTVETGKAFVSGMSVRIGESGANANTNFMDGTVTTYNAGTGTLTVAVTATGGSGTLASWSVRPTLASLAGGSGPTITASTAIAASSNRVRPVAMISDFQSVTLPDATTLATGGPLFVLPSTGAKTFIVRDNAGAMLAAVPAGGVAECYLRDNSTAAGAWSVSGRDLQAAAVVVDATLTSTLTQTVDAVARLTDTLSLHFARNSSGHPFVYAVDHSPGGLGVGTPVLIVASNLNVNWAQRISNTKAFAILDGTGGVYNITVSGVTCTVNGTAPSTQTSAITFTGAQYIASTSADLHIVGRISGGSLELRGIDTSGTSPVLGSAIGFSGGELTLLGIYAVSATTALVVFTDDTGSAGSPFSIRARMVTITAGSAFLAANSQSTIADILLTTEFPSICQLTATSYVVSYYQSAGTLMRAVHLGVSGTTPTFGTPFTVETVTLGALTNGVFNSNRFQPNLFRLSDTTAVLTYGFTSGSVLSRHVILTNSGGTLAAGAILYGLWTDANGGNFPQETTGFLAFSTGAAEQSIQAVSVNGTGLDISGTLAAPGGLSFIATAGLRFGLSGGIRGISVATLLGGRLLLYRFRATTPPQFVGAITLPNSDWGTTTNVPVEVAPSKVAVTSAALAQSGSTTAAIKLAILECAA